LELLADILETLAVHEGPVKLQLLQDRGYQKVHIESDPHAVTVSHASKEYSKQTKPLFSY